MKTFKEYIEPPVISFDFDDTIFAIDWNEEDNDYARDEDGNATGSLNQIIAKKIVDYKTQGHLVLIITSRYALWRKEVEDFLKDNNLFGYIDDIIFTNGEWKANTCKKHNVSIHYDDDPDELERITKAGIDGVLVTDENLKPIPKL